MVEKIKTIKAKSSQGKVFEWSSDRLNWSCLPESLLNEIIRDGFVDIEIN